jgi:hypothetical protein
MEKLFMSAGIVVAIVICFIGILKQPFKSFKEKHPKRFKALFTILTFVIAVGLAILDELYILCGKLLSFNFVLLLSTILTGVFFGYNGVYEGLNIKGFIKKIVEKLKELKAMTSNEKAIKYLNKITDIDKAITILQEKKNSNGEV